MARAVSARARSWAAGGDVALERVASLDLEAHPALARALADGVERGYDGALPELPEAGEWYLVRARGEVAGVLALQRDCPAAGSAALLAVAIAPAARGRALGVRALLLAERRLAREGWARTVARVPRTNGRGLYFMLRAGFTSAAGPPGDDGATWFARHAAPAGYRPRSRSAARRDSR